MYSRSDAQEAPVLVSTLEVLGFLLTARAPEELNSHLTSILLSEVPTSPIEETENMSSMYHRTPPAFARTQEEESKCRITSYREYEVDALALKADEGRGDRRNV